MESKEKWALLSFLLVCAIVAVILYKIPQNSEVVEKGASSLTLIIDFGTYKPHVYTENITIWHWNGYNYTVFTSPHNTTKWIFENITLENATIYNLLKRACTITNCSLGERYYKEYESVYITSIGGVENGQNNRFWQYWLNGDYGTLGASLAPLHNNDTVEWRFVCAAM